MAGGLAMRGGCKRRRWQAVLQARMAVWWASRLLCHAGGQAIRLDFHVLEQQCGAIPIFQAYWEAGLWALTFWPEFFNLPKTPEHRPVPRVPGNVPPLARAPITQNDQSPPADIGGHRSPEAFGESFSRIIISSAILAATSDEDAITHPCHVLAHEACGARVCETMNDALNRRTASSPTTGSHSLPTCFPPRSWSLRSFILILRVMRCSLRLTSKILDDGGAGSTCCTYGACSRRRVTNSRHCRLSFTMKRLRRQALTSLPNCPLLIGVHPNHQLVKTEITHRHELVDPNQGKNQ